MLKDVAWSEDRSYRTGSDNEPIEFYLNALANCNQLDLLLGYFSSSAISVLSIGFAKFLSAGGTVRMVINDILSKKDKEAIQKGLDKNISTTPFDLTDVQKLKETLNEYGTHFFECLSWLISNKKIDLKIIKPLTGGGISHFKSGVFSDGVDQIVYKGSGNFTSNAMLGNLEEVTTFLSWENGRSEMEIKSQNKYFEGLFLGTHEGVEYVDVDDIQIAIVEQFGNKDLNDLLVQEAELLERKRNLLQNNRIKRAINKVEEGIAEYIRQPRFPYAEGPRPYQIEACENWTKNGQQGIFAMATGTGKTITSLNCLLKEYQKSKDGTYHAIILVPTITLVEQWEKEARSFNFNDIIKVSSKFSWEGELATTISTSKKIKTSFIIITTYASFVKDRFYKYIKDLPLDTVFIADEAHNIGSPTVLQRLSNMPLQKRIGLSATPKRAYDIEGSSAMEAFFNDQEPFTYSFSMEKAIEEEILCKYYYHPHIVKLTTEELKEYIEISKKLSRFFNNLTGALSENDAVQMLLLKRKRIIHKAENKLAVTRQILETRFRKAAHLRYTFIYVPEGSKPELNEDDSADDETIKLINQYTREVGRIDPSIMVNQFVSGMADRNEVLEQFKEGKIQVIASMKCLDEGVDIPRAEYAIFCSSTGNPRQFIQRRGRILRKHKLKDIAVIHDLIVIPDLTVSEAASSTFKTERSLVEKELERVMYFASLAINPYETENVFTEVCEHYDLNIYTIHQKLKSND